MSRNKLYTLLSAACAVGFIWLAITYSLGTWNENDPGVCLFKRLTNIPCPSCGSTRSVLSILHGNFIDAIYLNPIGLLLVIIMIIAPIWIFYDIITKKESFLNSYKELEFLLQQKKIAIPSIVLILSNWIWNISKGL